MRISNVVRQPSGAITGDLDAELEPDWSVPDVRLDACMADYADCLLALDRHGSHTIHALDGQRETRLYRDGSAVVVQFRGPACGPASCRLDYSAFRGSVLALLRQYADQLTIVEDHLRAEADRFHRQLGRLEAHHEPNGSS